jgi:hypothetical protein
MLPRVLLQVEGEGHSRRSDYIYRCMESIIRDRCPVLKLLFLRFSHRSSSNPDISNRLEWIISDFTMKSCP